MPWYNSIGGGMKSTAAGAYSRGGCSPDVQSARNLASGPATGNGPNAGKNATTTPGYSATSTFDACPPGGKRPDHSIWATSFNRDAADICKHLDIAIEKRASRVGTYAENDRDRPFENKVTSLLAGVGYTIERFEDFLQMAQSHLKQDLKDPYGDGWVRASGALGLWGTLPPETGAAIKNLKDVMQKCADESGIAPSSKLLERLDRLEQAANLLGDGDSFLLNVVAVTMHKNKESTEESPAESARVLKGMIGDDAIDWRLRTEKDMRQGPLGKGVSPLSDDAPHFLTTDERDAFVDDAADAIFAKASKLDPAEAKTALFKALDAVTPKRGEEMRSIRIPVYRRTERKSASTASAKPVFDPRDEGAANVAPKSPMTAYFGSSSTTEKPKVSVRASRQSPDRD